MAAQLPSFVGKLHPRVFFAKSWDEIDQDISPTARGHRTLWAYVVGAICLTAMEYYGDRQTYITLLDWLLKTPDLPKPVLQTLEQINPNRSIFDDGRVSFGQLAVLSWWSLWRVIGYFILPALVVRFIWREKLHNVGLNAIEFSKHLPLYLLFFGVVLGGVVFVSFQPDFKHYYPFYEHCQRSILDWILWETCYLAQFFALEFFFRGFLLEGCRKEIGHYAIFAMLAPYCMIHFGKPILEVYAAVFAGLVLGTLAMRTRSIAGGFLIHALVAISMDVAALLQKGGLPTKIFP